MKAEDSPTTEQTELPPTTHADRQEMRQEGRPVSKNDAVRLVNDIDCCDELVEELVGALEALREGHSLQEGVASNLYGLLDRNEYTREDGKLYRVVKCGLCHMLLEYQDGDYKPEGSPHQEECPVPRALALLTSLSVTKELE